MTTTTANAQPPAAASTFGTQLWRQTLTEWQRAVRNRQFIFFVIFFPVGFYLLWANVFGDNSGDTLAGLNGATYLLVSMSAFGVLGGSMNLFGSRLAQERTHGWTRLLRTTPLRTSVYFLAKWLVALAISAIIVIVMSAVGYLQGAQLAGGQWLKFGFILWLGAFPFGALGLAIGYLTNAASSQIVGQLVYFFLSIFGGLWMPIEILPKAMQTLAGYVPTYHYAHLMRQVLTTGFSLTDVWVLLAYTVLFLLVAWWGWRRDESVTYS